jgi:hypothetical protein
MLKGVSTLIESPSDLMELTRTGLSSKDWGREGSGGALSVYKAAGKIVFKDDKVIHTKPHQKRGVPKSISVFLFPEGPSDLGASTTLRSLSCKMPTSPSSSSPEGCNAGLVVFGSVLPTANTVHPMLATIGAWLLTPPKAPVMAWNI